MEEKVRTTYAVAEPTRTLLAKMADELGVPMSDILTTSLIGYPDALDAGSVTRPDKDPLGDEHRLVTTTLYPTHSVRNRISTRATDLRITQGRLVSGALVHYREALEAGRIPKPKPTRKPKTEPVEKDEKPKRKPSPATVWPIAKPVLVNRAECPVCRKQIGVDAAGLLGQHVAHPSVRSRGVFALCEGSGQQPADPIIHSAGTDWRRPS